MASTTKGSRIKSIIGCVFFEILTLVLFFLSFNCDIETFRWTCIISTSILLFIWMISAGFKSLSDFFYTLIGTWIFGCIIGFAMAFIFRNPTGRLVTTIIISSIIGIIILVQIIKLIRKDYI